jgi:hypothetical protein
MQRNYMLLQASKKVLSPWMVADHLMSSKEDSLYAGSLIGSWAHRYLDHPEIPQPQSKHQVVAQLGEKGYTTYIRSGNHQFIADEPESFGGNNYGPSPYDLLSAALHPVPQ